MYLIKIVDGAPVDNPVTVENFRLLNPSVGFPAYLTTEDVEPYGFGLYNHTTVPTPGRYQKVEEVTPVQNSENIWEQTFALVDMTAEERSEADSEKALIVRAERDYKLSTSDWTQLPDSPADASVWTSYRQALRDVSGQETFPWDVTWPTQPS